jgi:hypothetical protein
MEEQLPKLFHKKRDPLPKFSFRTQNQPIAG